MFRCRPNPGGNLSVYEEVENMKTPACGICPVCVEKAADQHLRASLRHYQSELPMMTACGMVEELEQSVSEMLMQLEMKWIRRGTVL